MPYLAATATRCVDDRAYPAFVEFQFTEADGTTVTIIEKAVVVTDAGDLTGSSTYPVPVRFLCQVTAVEGEDGHQVADVVLDHFVEDQDGRSEFRVSIDQLTPGELTGNG